MFHFHHFCYFLKNELDWTKKHINIDFQFSLVQLLSCFPLFVTLWTAASQASLSITNSCPLSGWCHPTTSSFVVPFSSHLQSFPASGSFQMSQFFASGSQSIRVFTSASVLPMNIQDLFPSEWTGWISLQSKGLSRVFSNTTVQKHQFFVLSFPHSPTLTSMHYLTSMQNESSCMVVWIFSGTALLWDSNENWIIYVIHTHAFCVVWNNHKFPVELLIVKKKDHSE